MIILLVLVIAVGVALLRGGSLFYLAELNIKWRGAIIAGFLIQAAVYNDLWQSNNILHALTTPAYFFSLGLLVIALAKNYAIPGIKLIAFGFFLNVVVITLNGGYMPASLGALTTAGMSPLASGETNRNSIGMGSNSILPFLSDIFAIPKGFIFPNVFSIGDLLIAIGAVYLIQKTMVKPK